MEKKSAFLVVHLITQVIRKAFNNLLLTGETAREEQEGDQDSKMVNKYTTKVRIFSFFQQENCAGKNRYLTTRNISGCLTLQGGVGTLHFYSDPSTPPPPPPPMNEYPRQTSSRNPFSKQPTKKEGVRKGIFQRVPTKSEVVGICSSTRGVQKKMEVYMWEGS